MIIDGGNPVGLMYSELPTSGAPAKLVHNCTIFLCSLDVRNIDIDIDDPHRNPKMNTRIIELGN